MEKNDLIFDVNIVLDYMFMILLSVFMESNLYYDVYDPNIFIICDSFNDVNEYIEDHVKNLFLMRCSLMFAILTFFEFKSKVRAFKFSRFLFIYFFNFYVFLSEREFFS